MRSRTFEFRRAGLALAALLALGAAAVGDAERWLRRADDARPLIAGRMRLAVEAEGRGALAVEALIDVYLEREGAWLAIFRSGKQAGRRILARDGRFWLLVPGARNPVPIAGRQRLAGIASVADLVGLELAARFAATARPGEEPCGERACRVADLTASSPEAAYASAVLWVDRVSELPRRLLLRTPSGRDARELRFVDFRTDGPRTTVRRLEVRDLLMGDRGLPTSIAVVETDHRPPDPSAFTLEGARAVP